MIEPEEVFARTNYSRPHTIHCGPEAIYVSALGDPNGDGPGGIFMLDCETFEVLGQWEVDRGAQFLHYDFWWHLGFDKYWRQAVVRHLAHMCQAREVQYSWS